MKQHEKTTGRGMTLPPEGSWFEEIPSPVEKVAPKLSGSKGAKFMRVLSFPMTQVVGRPLVAGDVFGTTSGDVFPGRPLMGLANLQSHERLGALSYHNPCSIQ